MSILNIIGCIFLVAVLTAGIVIKMYTKKRLNELDGFGEITAGEDLIDNTINIQ